MIMIPHISFPRTGRELLRRRICMTMTTSPREGELFKRSLCTTMTTTSSLSQRRRRSFQKNALYDHDPMPSPFPEEEESFSEEGSV